MRVKNSASPKVVICVLASCPNVVPFKSTGAAQTEASSLLSNSSIVSITSSKSSKKFVPK